MPWYVYDRHANLMYVATTLAEAEAWAFAHWDVESVGDREEAEVNDYFYLLLARPAEVGFLSRDYQSGSCGGVPARAGTMGPCAS